MAKLPYTAPAVISSTPLNGVSADDALALVEIRRLIPVINKGQAELRRIREELGVKPGESLLAALGCKPLFEGKP